MLEDLEVRDIEYKSVGKFLVELKKEFGERDEKTIKIVELRKLVIINTLRMHYRDRSRV